MSLNSQATDLLLRQPIVILNEDEEEDEGASIPDKIRPSKKSDSDSDDQGDEVAEELEGGDEPEELPLVKEDGEDAGEDWEKQL